VRSEVRRRGEGEVEASKDLAKLSKTEKRSPNKTS